MADTVQGKLEVYPFIEAARLAGSLEGKVAIVTGASVGIGRETCKAFAAAGAKVACVARREASLKTLVEDIEQAGGKAIAVVADVSHKGAPQKVVAEVEQAFGPVDVLINNAGVARIGPLVEEDPDLDIWWRIYEVNVKAPMTLIRTVLPSMLKRNTGVLITIGSGVMNMDLPVMSAYSSSKAAIAKAHRALALELKDTEIRSHCITPGMVATELGSSMESLNKNALDHPLTKEFLSHISSSKEGGVFQNVQVTANSLVAVASDPRFKVLNGKFFGTTQDLEELLKDPESV